MFLLPSSSTYPEIGKNYPMCAQASQWDCRRWECTTNEIASRGPMGCLHQVNLGHHLLVLMISHLIAKCLSLDESRDRIGKKLLGDVLFRSWLNFCCRRVPVAHFYHGPFLPHGKIKLFTKVSWKWKFKLTFFSSHFFFISLFFHLTFFSLHFFFT